MHLDLVATVALLGVGFLLGGAASLIVAEHSLARAGRRQADLQRRLNAERLRLDGKRGAETRGGD